MNKTLGRFTGHVVVGAILFLVVAVVAAAVGVALEYINSWTNDAFLAVVLLVTKYAILGADLVLLLATLGYAIAHALKELRDDYHRKGDQDSDS